MAIDPDVRPAPPTDADTVARTLAAAFADDPVMAWAFPDDRQRRIGVMFRFVVPAIDLAKGVSTTVSEHEAVALWRRPGDDGDPGYWDRVGNELATEIDGPLDRIDELGSLMAAHHPHDREHWYLSAIGVRPDAQGRGLGTVLLAHTLAIADAEGSPAYLEATSPRSRALYARFGFEVMGEFAPRGGPPLWPMWRAPSPAN